MRCRNTEEHEAEGCACFACNDCPMHHHIYVREQNPREAGTYYCRDCDMCAAKSGSPLVHAPAPSRPCLGSALLADLRWCVGCTGQSSRVYEGMQQPALLLLLSMHAPGPPCSQEPPAEAPHGVARK
jgi:hypothetical protein